MDLNPKKTEYEILFGMIPKYFTFGQLEESWLSLWHFFMVLVARGLHSWRVYPYSIVRITLYASRERTSSTARATSSIGITWL